ncbi:Paratox, partial [Streptococcus agalactiae]|uniref:competence regulator inhibitor paratox n=1 Tax=Streptococcus agalactiae TaxID=1311 RepID=UPI003638ECFA
EFKEAIDKGYISGNTVAIVRKNGKIFDYVLPHEEVREEEVVTVESVVDVLEELDYIK